MAKQKKVKEERLEDILFECRDNLRGKASIGDKRDQMLTLVFLKFMNDRHDEQVEKMLAATVEEYNTREAIAKPCHLGGLGQTALPKRTKRVGRVAPTRRMRLLQAQDDSKNSSRWNASDNDSII